MNKFTIPRNRQSVIFNKFQGDALKVLTVCSAGCLRSPTAATILASEPFNFNTRSCGINEDFAIVPLTPTLLAWADVVISMEPWMHTTLLGMEAEMNNVNHFGFNDKDRTFLCLDIEDSFEFMQPELQEIMLKKFNKIFIGDENESKLSSEGITSESSVENEGS